MLGTGASESSRSSRSARRAPSSSTSVPCSSSGRPTRRGCSPRSARICSASSPTPPKQSRLSAPATRACTPLRVETSRVRRRARSTSCWSPSTRAWSSWTRQRRRPLTVSRIEASLAKHTVPRRGSTSHVGRDHAVPAAGPGGERDLADPYLPGRRHQRARFSASSARFPTATSCTRSTLGPPVVASLLLDRVAPPAARSHRAPHEISWVSGVALLRIGIAVFTGAVLPWGAQKAYTDARAGRPEFALFLVGEWPRLFTRGGRGCCTEHPRRWRSGPRGGRPRRP